MSYETDLPENIEMESVALVLAKKKHPFRSAFRLVGELTYLVRYLIFLLVNYYPIDIFNIKHLYP